MSEPSIFFEDVNEKQGTFHRRIFLMGGVTALGIFALGGQLALLQIVQGGKYKRLSAANQFNFRVVPPPRGKILDRNGNVIAGNRPSFRVLIIRNEIDDLDDTLDQISYVLPQVQDNRRRIVRDINQSQRFVPTVVAADLTWEEFSRVNLFAAEIPGVQAVMDEIRVYHYGGAFSHVVGYVSKISEKDLEAEGENPDPLLLHPGFRIGKQGVEKAFDKQLRGVAGAQKIEVNASGNIVAEDPDGTRPPTPGEDITLTLDAEVQARALEVFEQDSGSAVLLNIHTGEILCMVSAPSFDPNLFVSGISSKAYKLLNEYERRPLLDKAIGSTFAPGSTFKMASALSFLDYGIDPTEKVVCRGSYRFGNRTFRCHGVHGAVDMRHALKFSCDTYFYHMCNRPGVDRIAATAHKLGLGELFELEIEGQKKGLVPTTEWKRTYFDGTKGRPKDPKWHPGETLSVAIGQGYTTVSALQLAVYVSRIANGGKAVTPHLIKKIGAVDKDFDFKPLGIPPEHIQIVRDGMEMVSNDADGTAFRNSQLNLGDMKMAGKTGTAQVINYDRAGTRKATQWKNKDHGLFVCYAPVDNPRYAMAVIVQHGIAGGRFAAPKAREIMKVALLKDPELQARIVAPPPPEPVEAAETAPPEVESTEVAPESIEYIPPVP
ncbi:penicillin-binding protein 2 [Asticcacaulis sp. DW145]|uniref:Penicillin-binding protein 2 n=1 Tax=Asticcacaulis currens TaxID=2984210 RepID=A0ABT5IEF9_9CAUL|nr:penicillin-binding protein 2 [Asticcacaulis currens]MDC7694554.1 penicillin-binding protein 2 [Asticcacaulis currens]BEV10979.1 penicillin-binding protein 2 [Asticcacaulis sp. DW145]